MRLFIAIRFDAAFLGALTDFQAQMKARNVRGRFSPLENLHLTLAFVGEYGDPDAVMDAMAAVPFEPFSLRLEGIGHFGELYWAGLAESPALAAYARRLRRALAERNIPFDRKRFSPHITLIRKAEFHGETPLPEIRPPEAETEVTGVSLMRSDRGKHGHVYTEIGRIGETIWEDRTY